MVAVVIMRLTMTVIWPLGVPKKSPMVFIKLESQFIASYSTTLCYIKRKYGEFKRGEAPLSFFFPLSLKGEGDKGGEVSNIVR